MKNKTSSRNIFFLDNLRTFIFFLVVAYFSMLAYSPGTEYNMMNYILSDHPVIDSESVALFMPIVDYLDSFLFSVVFFLAGFFALPAIRKLGYQGYVKERTLRVLFPFLIAVSVITPIAYYPGYLLDGNNGDFLLFWTYHYFQNFWNPGPLWVMGLIYLFEVFTASGVSLLGNRYEDFEARLDRSNEKVYLLSVMAMLVAIYAVSFMILPSRDIDSWQNLFGPFWFQVNKVLVYFAFFLCGVVLGGSFRLKIKFLSSESGIVRLWYYWVFMSVVLYLLVKFFENVGILHSDVHLNSYMQNLFYATLMGIVGINGALSLVAVFSRFVDHEVGFITEYGRSAFFGFLIFFPFVTISQYMLLSFSLYPFFKFLIVLFVSYFLTTLFVITYSKLVEKVNY